MRLAEHYANTLYLGHPCIRWWAHPRILVGGSILDADDYRHLEKDFGITAVLNVESEHGDTLKGIPRLCEIPVPDNGSPFPMDVLMMSLVFAKSKLDLPESKIYVHCQMGGSRSPAFAYMILRYVFGCSKETALFEIRTGKPPGDREYGGHPYHQAYLKSIEEFLSDLSALGSQPLASP